MKFILNPATMAAIALYLAMPATAAPASAGELAKKTRIATETCQKLQSQGASNLDACKQKVTQCIFKDVLEDLRVDETCRQRGLAAGTPQANRRLFNPESPDDQKFTIKQVIKECEALGFPNNKACIIAGANCVRKDDVQSLSSGSLTKRINGPTAVAFDRTCEEEMRKAATATPPPTPAKPNAVKQA